MLPVLLLLMEYCVSNNGLDAMASLFEKTTGIFKETTWILWLESLANSRNLCIGLLMLQIRKQ